MRSLRKIGVSLYRRTPHMHAWFIRRLSARANYGQPRRFPLFFSRLDGACVLHVFLVLVVFGLCLARVRKVPSVRRAVLLPIGRECIQNTQPADGGPAVKLLIFFAWDTCVSWLYSYTYRVTAMS